MTKSNLPVFLKSLTIQGFKSFADKITIDLEPGLSVIVGPNGSGKSNIADAVRWVLGEQSAKSLRGTRMEDVIFSGSSSRKGVGIAEVSLVFDNSTGILPIDYKEVTISRRVYRDGEGQYFINRSPCRLKDIQELFMDTGVGKEGFSIIGQGRVDEILNQRSEERRTLIEEASGITKYRHRKKEALKRLEETEQNLTRLEDILNEIESQLGPLATQAELAQKSVQLNQELKQLEVQLIVKDLYDIEQKRSGLTEEIAVQRAELAQKMSELAQLEQSYTEGQLELTALNESVQNQQQRTYELEQRQNSKQHEIILRQERQSHIEEQIKRIDQELSAETERLESMISRIDSLDNKLSVLRATVEHGREQLKRSEDELQALRAQKDVEQAEQLKSEIYAALSEKAAISNEISVLEQKHVALEHRRQQLEQERENALNEWSDNEALRAKQLETAKLCESREAELARDLTAKREELERHTTILKELEQQYSEMQRLTDSTRARHNALQAMEESLEGYSQGVREILKAHRQGKAQCAGVCGTVAEVVKTSKEYELALDTALGAGLQNIITRTETDAKACIAYLKQHRLGRVTFLPLDTIRPTRLETAGYQKLQGFIGLASDLAQVDPQYKPALDFLLGRTLVASDLEAASQIARAGDYRVRVVTLEGDLINAGGSMTGGSIQNRGGGLLGRSRELEELADKLKQHEAGLKTLNEQLAAQRETIQTLQAERQSLERELAELREKRAVLAVNLENLQTQNRRLTERITYLDLEIDRCDEEKLEHNRSIESEQAKLKLKEQELDKLNLQLKELEAQAEATAQQIEQLSEQITREKVQLAKWEEEYAQTADLLQRDREALEEKRQAIADKQRQKDELGRAISSIIAEIERLNEELAQGQAELDRQRQVLIQLREQREQLSTQILKQDDTIKETRRQIQALEQSLHSQELKGARWEAEWDANSQRLFEEFELTWEQARDMLPETGRSTLAQRIKEIKQAIEDLGPVNHAALEEYPKLEQRYEFLTTQRDDLVQAHASLINLVEELDQTMSERFKAGFEAVNDAFQRVFTELFQGGRAELKLSNPENLLETGIEIIAQPPGKKPQLLSLLSGGERALTAIAILFALLHVKPSPFCILDEIEAALDESNVTRFASYIQKLSSNTQFMVISHRRGTMEAADALYGVTMEESGVSKLLTVKLGGEKKEASA